MPIGLATAAYTFLGGLLDGHLRAKRILSWANATLGIIRTASFAVHTIELKLVQTRGLNTKHTIKEVNRLLSNEGIDIDADIPHWVGLLRGRP